MMFGEAGDGEGGGVEGSQTMTQKFLLLLIANPPVC